VTYEEYIGIEAASTEKHTFWEGEVFAMAGASFAHSQIATNLLLRLGAHLSGTPCRVFGPDTRVRAPQSSNAVYPDLSVVCHGPNAHPGDAMAATNPKVIVEILSDSSEAFDRGDKFAYYMQFSSLMTYVLIAQSRQRVEVYERDPQNDSWVLRVSTEGSFSLASIDAQIAVAEVYDGVASLFA
jgi:Uma2 family endonuclease